MKNKRLAIFLSIFVALALIIVLSSAVFALESVTIKYHSNTHFLTGDDNLIIKSAGFRYGENVFLSNKSKYISNLESKNSYIRVLNIETIFPNKFVIHAVEREEVFVFKTDNYYIVADEYLKVLDRPKTFANLTENAIVVENSAYSQTSVQTGAFLQKDEYYKQLCDCFREWKTEYADFKSKIKTITVNYVDGLNSQDDNLLLTMWDDVEILISKSKIHMSDKLNFAFSAYESLSGEAQTIHVFEDSAGNLSGVFS